jgi:hypothetical protein
MLRSFTVPAKSTVLLGAPARPMPTDRSDRIARMVASIDGIKEAHLPQCFVIGVMKGPAQVLVVVIEPGADHSAILNALDEGLTQILPAGEQIDVWPVSPDSSRLTNVRAARCTLFEKERP